MKGILPRIVAIGVVLGVGWALPGRANVPIVDLPVTFSVLNVNRSKVPCVVDGLPYEIHGHLVAPSPVLSAPDPAVTLYLHGGTAGEWMWHFKEVPGYDYASELAAEGHASVVVDMLGYDGSMTDVGPNGNDWCFGANADTVHQVIERLRSGDYTLDGASGGPAFKRVALAGQSGGGITADVESYSFGDIDALILVGWVDVPATFAPLAFRRLFLDTGSGVHRCAAGGEPSEDDGTGPEAYAYTWSSPEIESQDVFYDAEPAVLDAVVGLTNRDPCGYLNSAIPTIMTNNLYLSTVTVPILVVGGDHDLVTPAEFRLQAARYVASPDVSVRIVKGAGHAGMLERRAPEFRSVVARWLDDRGF